MTETVEVESHIYKVSGMLCYEEDCWSGDSYLQTSGMLCFDEDCWSGMSCLQNR